jgi:copper chaperone CopZ
MTPVDVLFRYGMSPGENEMGAMGQLSDVYGIRRVQFQEAERTIRVEYDATRLNESSVEKLLRSAGFDIRERLALA